MKTQSIVYQDGNVTLRGFVAFDDESSHKRPGVLVMPEAFRLGAHATQRAERLASLRRSWCTPAPTIRLSQWRKSTPWRRR
jgi:hypothetical protein